MENLRYILVSYLYIAILLLFKSLRYYLSTKSCLPKLTPWKVVIFGAKIDILILKKSLKNGKSHIHNSFLLIHCNFIII